MAEKLRIAKIEDVRVSSGGEDSSVTLHLTAHHLILVEQSSPLSGNQRKAQDARTPTRESWFAYPMIASCTFRPTPHNSSLQSSIRLRCRDFKFLTLNFAYDRQARDVYESIKGATCQLGGIDKLYAFNYKPPLTERQINGWSLYDAKIEWKRQGICIKSVERGWRISNINADYSFSPSYPALLVVPKSISDNTLNYAGRYRSRARIPVLTYLHSVNNCSITRSSQPLAGIRGNRSIQDEKLVYSCFSASQATDSRLTGESESNTILEMSKNTSQDSLESNFADILDKEQEDETFSPMDTETVIERTQPFGAQQHNLIVDARPTVNALAMQAIGLGSENMDHYKFATKVYLGIDNIHVMRESLGKVIEAIKDSDVSKLPPSRERLAKSGWLKHITNLLEGSALIALQVGVKNSNVLIHCSDGWDRTSQLSALSQILLDPYYRTINGFIVLVEKDWLAFGHRFQQRSGFLNSEKWFSIQYDALAGSVIQPGSGGEGRGDAIENALLSARRFFNKTSHSPESTNDLEYDTTRFDEMNGKKAGKDDCTAEEATKPKETSPIFHQFLDATYQLLTQYPSRFEFNERFLRRLLYHLYSCQYGTFLYNSEKSRLNANVRNRTSSVWDYFLSRRAEFTNKEYDGGQCDDRVKGKERLLLPKISKIRWWHEVFNRSDTDMNGPLHVHLEGTLGSHFNNSSTDQNLIGTDRTVQSNRNVIRKTHLSNSSTTTGPLTGIREGIASLGIGVGKAFSGAKSPSGKQSVELEMQ
ncbi:Phosphoinositide 3-phosphatase [Erysiphe neolycopersici]|uniref:Phosphoinositide 3-phosphatase n=1 Tax=Erysiphe neolycopersici TaxID=212602 RepID=A0A420I226_9PEZI|nr:Phosphoinositide 3-phosphatase [Erysiphe neolycopersici]